MNLLPAHDYQPYRYGAVEAAIMRVLFIAVVWWSLPSATDVGDLVEQKNPTGLAVLFNLTWLSNPGVYTTCKVLIGIASVLYLANRFMALAIGVIALIHILIFTLDNSQGATNHAYQLLSLVLLVQFLTYLSPWVIRRLEAWKKKKFKPLFAADIRVSDLAIFYTQQAIAAGYVLAGVSKVIRSKGLWVWQSPDVAVELIKTNAQNFNNRLEIDAAYEHRLQVAQWMIDNPMLTRVLMGGGLFIELFAFLALRNRFFALLTGVALLALHWGIDVSMGLFFKHNVALIVIYLINVPFWVSRSFPGPKEVTPPPPRETEPAS